ncbi:hypothetical protein HIM_06377 [Hirsutella minnesotensis 3608]|uniref:Transcription factor domain-containing protein n=1 Tax=Hirsutella minnesotensis 3608 TaxID=1043627 RepID=A0A0F7ZJ52_9HYPO|nr:hypothetical protein HIM_06377 [Hirsutella minnesotensis 3608]
MKELVFRDKKRATETEQAKPGRRSPKATGKLYGAKGDRVALTAPNTLGDVQYALQLPIQTQAACFFMANFATVPDQATSAGFMEFLVPMQKTFPLPLHFELAFDACALASLNNRHIQDATLRKRALDKYVKALASLSLVVRDPLASKDFTALASTLLCSLFEHITGLDHEFSAWSAHIDGAIQLVQNIGREELLQTELGRAIFGAVRLQMIIKSVGFVNDKRLPLEWWTEGVFGDKTALECERLMLGFLDLRWKVGNLLSKPSSNTNVQLGYMIMKCQVQDAKFVEWTINLPDYYKYETLGWADDVADDMADDMADRFYRKLDVFPGRIDDYSRGRGTLSVWNMMRVGRIGLSTLIIRCAAQMSSLSDYRTTPAYASAVQTCTEAAADIIASVPCGLGWCPTSGRPSAQFVCGDDDASKGLHGVRLMMSLAIVHSLDYLTVAQRSYIQGRLQYIGTHLGIHRAAALCQVTPSRQPNPWESILTLVQISLRVPSMRIARDSRRAASPTGGSKSFTSFGFPVGPIHTSTTA